MINNNNYTVTGWWYSGQEVYLSARDVGLSTAPGHDYVSSYDTSTDRFQKADLYKIHIRCDTMFYN